MHAWIQFYVGPHVIRTYKIGPIPVLSCAPLPYGNPSLEKVIKVLADEHGLVRQVVVKTRSSEVRRPVHKLCYVVPANLYFVMILQLL